MNDLSLDTLPDLPQSHSLAEIAPILWQQPGVMALWVGGSLARGEGDPYSDIDLRLAVEAAMLEAWKSPDFETLFAEKCLGRLFLPFGPETFLHHLVLSSGEIYDLWVQNATHEVHDEAILLLGCRDAALAQHLQSHQPVPTITPLPADGEKIRQQLIDYWINTHKHRKVLHRGLDLLIQTGIQEVERAALLRLWYVQATGLSWQAGTSASIYSLTQLTRTVAQTQGKSALELLGAPLTNRQEIIHAIERMRDEISRVGQALATSLGFAYPLELEQMVRRHWAEFRLSIS